MSALARSGFRRLVRAANFAFKEDKFAKAQAKIQVREEFAKNRNVVNPLELQELFKGIDEVEEILKFNIVQGTLNDHGNYDVSLNDHNREVVHLSQDLPNGPELAPVDTSILGKGVKVEKVGGKRIPLDGPLPLIPTQLFTEAAHSSHIHTNNHTHTHDK